MEESYPSVNSSGKDYQSQGRFIFYDFASVDEHSKIIVQAPVQIEPELVDL